MKHDQETKFNLLIPPINPSDGEEGHWQPEGGHKVDKTFPHHTFAKRGGEEDWKMACEATNIKWTKTNIIKF